MKPLLRGSLRQLRMIHMPQPWNCNLVMRKVTRNFSYCRME